MSENQINTKVAVKNSEHKNFLINKKVTVRKMLKPWLGVGARVFEGSTMSIYVPMEKSGSFKWPLNDELQEFLEKKINYPAGTLSKNSTFWNTYSVDIRGYELKLDLMVPEDLLKYYVLKSCTKQVSGSLEEYNLRSTPLCIIEATAEAKSINKVRKVKATALSKFGEMSPAEKINYLIATGRKVDNVDPEIIDKNVGDDAELTPEYFISIVDNPDLSAIIFINRCLQFGILRKQGPSIFHESNFIGVDITAAIIFLFKTPENGELLAMLKAQLEQKIVNSAI